VSHLTGTLEIVRQRLVAAAPWVAVCDDAGAAAADRVILGMGGFLADGSFRPGTGAGSASVGLPLAVIMLDPFNMVPGGHRKWSRQGAAIIDLALSGPADAEGYLGAAQTAEDIAEAFRADADAGALLSDEIAIVGPPLLLTTAPGLLRGAWTTRLRVSWTHGDR
jgi:hypothetical protein